MIWFSIRCLISIVFPILAVGWTFWWAGWNLGWGQTGCYEFVHYYRWRILAVCVFALILLYRSPLVVCVALGLSLSCITAVMSFWFMRGCGARVRQLDSVGRVTAIEYSITRRTFLLTFAGSDAQPLEVRVGSGRRTPKCVLVPPDSPSQSYLISGLGWVPDTNNQVRGNSLVVRWDFGRAKDE